VVAMFSLEEAPLNGSSGQRSRRSRDAGLPLQGTREGPLTANGHLDATQEERQVRAWWGRRPNVLARVIDRPPLVQEHLVNGPFASVLVAAVGARDGYLSLGESFLSVYPSSVAGTLLEEYQ
jgi:hypothetical protein